MLRAMVGELAVTPFGLAGGSGGIIIRPLETSELVQCNLTDWVEMGIAPEQPKTNQRRGRFDMEMESVKNVRLLMSQATQAANM